MIDIHYFQSRVCKDLVENNVVQNCDILTEYSGGMIGSIIDSIDATPRLLLSVVGTGELDYTATGETDVTLHVVGFLVAKANSNAVDELNYDELHGTYLEATADSSAERTKNNEPSAALLHPDYLSTNNELSKIDVVKTEANFFQSLSKLLSYIPIKRFTYPGSYPAIKVESMDLHGLTKDFKPDTSTWRTGVSVLSRASGLFESAQSAINSLLLWSITWEQKVRVSNAEDLSNTLQKLPDNVEAIQHLDGTEIEADPADPDDRNIHRDKPVPNIIDYKIDYLDSNKSVALDILNINEPPIISFTLYWGRVVDKVEIENIIKKVAVYGRLDGFGKIGEVNSSDSIKGFEQGATDYISLEGENPPIKATHVLVYAKNYFRESTIPKILEIVRDSSGIKFQIPIENTDTTP